MKICIIGAGAIGGFLGVKLALSGQAKVTVLARGATLDALRRQGWRLQLDRQMLTAQVETADNAADLGVQDLVIITVKGPALMEVARGIAPLLGPDTIVLPAMNGVPWWFCERIQGFAGRTLESVDPGGTIAAAIPFAQIVGCVVHASAAISEPGLVRHRRGAGLIVGEPCGGRSARVQRVADLLRLAGFEVTHSADVRHDIWYKLWGNLTMNPVSAITGATVDRVLADPLMRAFCSAAMLEASHIGALIGCPIDQSPEERHAITADLGAFKTSMLQDVESGRPLELDAIIGAVHEIGVRLDVSTPMISALLALTRLFGRVRGLYPQKAEVSAGF